MKGIGPDWGKDKMSRPSRYTEEMGDLICERLVGGLSIRQICEANDMPAMSTIFKWLADVKGFSEQYARAKQEQAEALADEIVAIADEPDWITTEKGVRDNVERSKLRVEARKWVAARLLPKKYGDRVDLNHRGETENPLNFVLTRIGERER